MKSAVAIRHVYFEDMGTLEPLLQLAGYTTHYCGAEAVERNISQIEKADILVVLGAPIGACDESIYPFLTQELRLIERRLNARLRMLGICLGAQLMARVLGASVARMARKEIGFSPIELTAAGLASPLASLPKDTAVLHWHGDQFAIPAGTENLGRTELCPHQAFAVGDHALGFQFHLEADAERIEPWLIGHAAELAHAGIDPRELRAQAKQHGAGLKAAADAVFGRWLEQL